jgi:hypothetical protein
MLTELLAGPNLAAGGDFDRLPIPFRAVATDLATGQRVVLASGSLERAVARARRFRRGCRRCRTPTASWSTVGSWTTFPSTSCARWARTW